MRIPNVVLSDEAGRRIEWLAPWVVEFLRKPDASGRFWFYGTQRRKPTERCAVMGDGIDVIRPVVVG